MARSRHHEYGSVLRSRGERGQGPDVPRRGLSGVLYGHPAHHFGPNMLSRGSELNLWRTEVTVNVGSMDGLKLD